MAMKRVCDWCRQDPVVEARPHFDVDTEADHYDACPAHIQDILPVAMARAYPAPVIPQHAEVTITFVALMTEAN